MSQPTITTKPTKPNTNTNTKKYVTMKRLAKTILAVIIVLSIAKALSSYRDQLNLAEVNLQWLAIAFTMALCYRLVNACGWSFVLRALNINMSTGKAVRIWLTSEACRWLPGSVWSYGSRALQAKNHGVSTVTAGASLVLEMLLTIGAWCITAVIGLAFYREAFFGLLRKIPLERIPTSGIAFALALAVTLGVVLYAARNTIRKRLASKLDPVLARLHSLRQARPNVRKCLYSLGFYVAMCFVNGVAAWVVFRAVAPQSQVPLLAVVGANAAAWLIGFFAIMAPGGLVVREGAMATLLVAWLPAEQAIAAAIIWRFLQIVVEVACIAGAYAGPALQRGWDQTGVQVAK